MREGFYAVHYKNPNGSDWGIALIALDSGQVVGVDVGGGHYDGTYTNNVQSGNIDMDVMAKFPGNIPLVQGGRTPPQGMSFPVKASFPKQTTGTPINVQTPLGPVTASIRFIRDFPNP